MSEIESVRPSWDDYFMAIAEQVAERSTCMRRHCGAVLVQDRRILATGYNGAPSGVSHCADVGCRREAEKVSSGQRHELCRGLHAEQNALLQAALHGVSIKSAKAFSTHQPCSQCTKMLINAGVEEVVYCHAYPDPLAAEIALEAGLPVRRFSNAPAELALGSDC